MAIASTSQIPETSRTYYASLQAHNAAFTSLLQLIPPQFYLAAEEDDTDPSLSNKYLKNKRKKSAKEVEARERKDKIRQAKKAKLNPDNFQTVLDVQDERRRRAASLVEDDIDLHGFEHSEGERDSDVDSEASGAGAGAGAGAGDTDEDLVDSDVELESPHVNGNMEQANSDSTKIQTAGERIEALRARLHARIQGLQRARKTGTGTGTGADTKDEGDDADSTISSRDDLLEERRRRRGEMRDRRRRERKEARRAAAVSHPAPATKPGTKPLVSLPVPAPVPVPVSPRASSSSAASSLAFNALQLPGAAPKKKNKLALPSDPKQALSVLQTRKTPIEKWDKALAAAEGVKIRDDEKLLRKSIKRREKAKEKSAKAWAERSKTEKDAQAARQKKRNENIAARKATSSTQAKGKGKSQITKKARPGFEGKKIGAKRK